MLTLDQLRTNRNVAFWTLHTAGWSVYALTQYFGGLLYETPGSFGTLIVVATAAGFLLSIPMRYAYRKLWGRSPQAIAFGILLISYVTALGLRAVINSAYYVVEPDDPFESPFQLFGGTTRSTILLLCWSALYFGIKYYESLQQQREAALKAAALAQEAQLKMLRYQLNPHFLFNTLNAISTLILDNQNRTANHAVTRLSEFLRYTLDQDPMKKVTLRQELEALELYLGTERLRFGERLHLEYAIEDSSLEALVPSLLLQPLLENSLKYAVSTREQGGLIRIESRSRGTMLEISVTDDGPGITEPSPSKGLSPLREQSTSSERRGVGLRNIRERLAVLYGPNHRFALMNSLPGLRVEMALPFELAPGEPGFTTSKPPIAAVRA
jgi:two-component system, LytTR family, sensor kinase